VKISLTPTEAKLVLALVEEQIETDVENVAYLNREGRRNCDHNDIQNGVEGRKRLPKLHSIASKLGGS